MAYTDFNADWVFWTSDGVKLFVPFDAASLDSFNIGIVVRQERLVFIELLAVTLLDNSYQDAYNRFLHLLEY